MARGAGHSELADPEPLCSDHCCCKAGSEGVSRLETQGPQRSLAESKQPWVVQQTASTPTTGLETVTLHQYPSQTPVHPARPE